MSARNGTIPVPLAFSIGVLGQQAAVTIAVVTAMRRSALEGFNAKLRAVVFIFVMFSVAFAVTSNITFSSSIPPTRPWFSDAENLVFALPTVITAITFVLRIPKR
jgi:hypothetical protein